MAERRAALAADCGDCDIDRPANGFLRSLSASTYKRLAPELTPVELGLGALVFEDGEPVDYVYFPITSLISLVANGRGGERVEAAMVGCEGAAGLTEGCGSLVASTDGLVQVDGAAFRAPASVCRALAHTDSEFGAAAWRMAEYQTVESRQSSLCQAMHPVEHRFARWMCESLDRSGGREPLPMTQEFLAAMLGVQRTTVSTFAAALQRQGVINYRRGRVEILDRAGLESLACDCRRVTVLQRARLGLAPP